MYKRVLLKISGEQLSGKHASGIDPEVVHYLARECAKVVQAGCQLVLVIGGGNMVRGASVAGNGISRVVADQMGMLSGLINSMAVTDILRSEGLRARCLTNIHADQVADPYSFRLAVSTLDEGAIVVVAGGIARPFFTHDTGAVSIALELSCDVVLKATKVEGVFDKDPATFPDARLLKDVSFRDAVANDDIKVMDKAALGLAMEQNMPVIVFNPMVEDALVKAVQGEPVGSHVS